MKVLSFHILAHFNGILQKRYTPFQNPCSQGIVVVPLKGGLSRKLWVVFRKIEKKRLKSSFSDIKHTSISGTTGTKEKIHPIPEPLYPGYSDCPTLG